MARLSFLSSTPTYFPTPDFVFIVLTQYSVRHCLVYSASSTALVRGSGMRSGPKKPSTIGNNFFGSTLIPVLAFLVAPLAAPSMITTGLFGFTTFTPMSMKWGPIGC